MEETLHYGMWTHDGAGLPCFDGHFTGAVAVDRPFTHGFSTGRISALVNRWGLLHVFTTEAGYVDLSRNTNRVRSGLFLELEHDGRRHPLIHGDLPERTAIRYGIGYASFQGTWRDRKTSRHQIEITQEFYTPPDRACRVGGHFRLRNTGDLTLATSVRVCSQLEIGTAPADTPRLIKVSDGACRWTNAHPVLGEIRLSTSEPGAHGRVEDGVSLILERAITLHPGEVFEISAELSYGLAAPTSLLPSPNFSRDAWAKRLHSLSSPVLDAWIRDEARWCAGQLHSFEAYDSSVAEYYLNLGGYGWAGFGVREVPETALAVAPWDPELAFSCLRWTAKVQATNGDLPHCHAFLRPKFSELLSTGHRESDNEIWWILACVEVVRMTGRNDFFDEGVSFWDGSTASIWEHLRRAVLWIRDGIGVGPHGLIRIVEGDWNDYLSHVGARGVGESMMNTGMACRALARLIPFAEVLDPPFASLCSDFLESLRTAAANGFDECWFVRGYTDDGQAFGTVAEDRVFLNAQSWCVLGGCGTAAMRESAMRAVLEKSHSTLGLTLMSQPYPCPPPPEISRCPIPPGDGENAGLWPQTIHWAIWALAELGWPDEALEIWRRVSLRNHARLFPEVPFGIFNAPDCYSSHFAGEREGWTQVEMLERAKFPPMNPGVAWSTFSLQQILSSQLTRAAQQPTSCI